MSGALPITTASTSAQPIPASASAASAASRTRPAIETSIRLDACFVCPTPITAHRSAITGPWRADEACRRIFGAHAPHPTPGNPHPTTAISRGPRDLAALLLRSSLSYSPNRLAPVLQDAHEVLLKARPRRGVGDRPPRRAVHHAARRLPDAEQAGDHHGVGGQRAAGR